ncbi:MAG: DnaD domain protein [Chloroflexi bacterium]|nr:DnaD domain protein [Chloroflexota bacterium]
MKKFSGYTDSETFTQVPNTFFRQLLIEMDDADELKVTLYALWRFEHMESRLRFLREQDFAEVVPNPGAALEKAVQRGSLLQVEKNAAALYFLNSPRGRAAAEAFAKGQRDVPAGTAQSNPPPERPNIFKLYEENIGPLTPLLADALKDAEQTYPPEWVAEALEIAVKSNKHNWKYVEAILKRWKVEGHAKAIYQVIQIANIVGGWVMSVETFLLDTLILGRHLYVSAAALTLCAPCESVSSRSATWTNFRA